MQTKTRTTPQYDDPTLKNGVSISFFFLTVIKKIKLKAPCRNYDEPLLKKSVLGGGSKRIISTVDPFQGKMTNPITLNKYVYGNDNPVMFVDPSGRFSLIEQTKTIAISTVLMNTSFAAFNVVLQNFRNVKWSGKMSSVTVSPTIPFGGTAMFIKASATNEYGTTKASYEVLGGGVSVGAKYGGSYDASIEFSSIGKPSVGYWGSKTPNPYLLEGTIFISGYGIGAKGLGYGRAAACTTILISNGGSISSGSACINKENVSQDDFYFGASALDFFTGYSFYRSK